MYMQYNIHPIFVHFPIALLFLYSVIKVLPWQRWFPKISWKQIEIALLIVGVLGAFVSLATGETAEHLTRPNHQLVELHSTFATIATWLYALLLAGEVFTVAFTRFKIASIGALGRLLTHHIYSKVLAILALIAITMTGLLGGALVYGVSADPFTAIVLSWFGIAI